MPYEIRILQEKEEEHIIEYLTISSTHTLVPHREGLSILTPHLKWNDNISELTDVTQLTKI